MSTWPLTLPLTLLPTTPGAGGSSEVGSVFDVAIAGTGYMVDWAGSGENAYRHDTAQLLRPQSDTGSLIGEQSLNPEGPWRRSVGSFHRGAGQRHRDRDGAELEGSDPARFWTSEGIDVWTENEVALLNATAETLNSANTNLLLAVAGSRLYVADGQTLKYSANPLAGSPTWTTVTGTPGTTITGLTSDGYQVYASYGASGVYETDTSKSTAASWATGTATRVAYVRGRIMVADGRSIYNPVHAVGATAVALAGTVLFTHRSANFAFVGFAETLNQIYAAGFSGDKSEIYRIAIKEDGTGLDVPIIAGVLPDGEVLTCIYGYLGFILLGTTKGVRFAATDASGNLTIGALIETGATVRDFEGQGRFVWFTWERFSSSLTGLGRIDLTSFSDTEALAPSYATDLSVASQADVTAVVTFANKTVFSVSGDGVKVETADKVASGTISTGLMAYGLSESKTAQDFILTADFSNGGSIAVDLTANSRPAQRLGVSTSSGTSAMRADEIAGNHFEITLTFTRSATDITTGPVLTSGTLRAFPQVEATKYIAVSVLLRPALVSRSGTIIDYDANEVRAVIDALWRSQQITTFQEGNQGWSVLVSDYSYRGEQPPDKSEELYGALDLRLKVVS